METRPGAMGRYWRLAVETLEYQKRLQAAGILKFRTWIEVDEAARACRYLAEQIPAEHHDPTLFARWKAWAKEFDAIYQASPKWRLKEMISEVSETHACGSWPRKWEKDIWTWATSDGPGFSCPFVDRRGCLTPDFRQRLRILVNEVNGFLYRCEETGHIVFAPSEDLEKVWRHLDHLAEIDRNKPFGFFNDATRPNFQMRAPTEEETRIMAVIRARSVAQKGWHAKLFRYLKRLP